MGTRSLTVVQVVPELESGGVERGTLEVGAELVRRGHRSIVISGGGRLVEQLTLEGSEHIAWDIGVKSPLTLRFAPALRKLLRAERVDILHARSRVPAWIAYLAWKGMRKGQRPRFVTTMHGMHSVSRYSAIMTRGERVIAVSEAMRRHILDNYPRTDPQRVIVIPRGIDPDEFPHGYRPDEAWLASWKDEFPRLGETPLVTLPGRITRLKGHHELIELMSRLRERGVAAHGLIVGGEDPRRRAYADELRRRIDEEGLQSSITFTGHRGDIREIYAISRVVLSLSTQPEAFGRTALEALSIGAPVVGYDHGGVGEVLSALLPEGRVPAGDVELLVERVAGFLASPPRVPKNEMYLLGRMLDETLAVYASLADE